VIRQKNHIAVLAGLWAVVHTLLFWHYGIRIFEDSATYKQAADFLASHGYLADPDQVFYNVPIFCIALFGLLTADPSALFVGFQCVVSAFAALALYRAAATLFGDALAGLLAAGLYIIWWDMIHWNTTVMTESLAGSIICFLLYSLVHYQARGKDKVVVALWVVASVLTRPTGLIVAVSVLLFFIARTEKRIVVTDIRFVLLCVVVLVVLLTGAQYLFTRWDFTDQYRRGNIITYADIVEGTSLHYPLMRLDEPLQMPDTDAPGLLRIVLFVVGNPWYFFKAMILKIAFLLSGMRPYYTILHNVYALMWNGMIYLFFIKGCRMVVRKDIVIVVISVAVLNSLLVGISSVDWDNRFFVPMVPGLVLIAGGGMAAWVRRVVTKNGFRNTN